MQSMTKAKRFWTFSISMQLKSIFSQETEQKNSITKISRKTMKSAWLNSTKLEMV